MTLIRAFSLCTSIITAVAINGHEALAQTKNDPPKDKEQTKETRIGDAYYLSDCPVSGKKLGSMGDPVIKIYDGREVRFCCPACPEKFEKDRTANLAKLDEKIIKDQAPLYTLTTSLVTGKDLPARPFQFVYGNRLIRLAAESERAEFLKNPKKYIAELDKIIVANQGKNYPLETCVVSKEKLGGMGDPVDVVVAGRLIRLCCNGCKKEIEKDPAKVIAVVDAAREKSEPHSNKPHHSEEAGHKHEPHGH